MTQEKSIVISDYELLRTIKDKLQLSEKNYTRAKSSAKRKYLKEYIDDLKMDLAWALLDCGEYEKGLFLYGSLSWEIYGEMKCNGMARALTEMGFYDEARKLLEAGLRRFPNSYALWVAMAALYENLGDDFESLKCLEIALQFASEDNSTGLYNKALILMKIGSYGDAVSIIDDLIQKYPDDPKYLTERGSCALDMGYPQEALQYYQNAMEAWRRSPTIYEGLCVYSGLCSSYMELGMKREAMEIALEGLKKFPDEDPVLYHNVGATFLEMGWREEAIDALKKGVKKFPDDEELKKFLKELEDNIDNPEDGEKLPILGLILLMALLYKKLRGK
jgi:tetratricopeptide (TPR) repeat protein